MGYEYNRGRPAAQPAAVAQQTHNQYEPPNLHRHFFIDDRGNERMMIELRMTRR